MCQTYQEQKFWWFSTMGWVKICYPLFLRFWAPFKILVLLALYIKNNSRKVYLNLCRDVRCELESLFFYAFECCSKFFFYWLFLTWILNTYKEFVLAKVTLITTKWCPNHSEWLSRQDRTGASNTSSWWPNH